MSPHVCLRGQATAALPGVSIAMSPSIPAAAFQCLTTKVTLVTHTAPFTLHAGALPSGGVHPEGMPQQEHRLVPRSVCRQPADLADHGVHGGEHCKDCSRHSTQKTEHDNRAKAAESSRLFQDWLICAHRLCWTKAKARVTVRNLGRHTRPRCAGGRPVQGYEEG